MRPPFARTYFDLAEEQGARYGQAPAVIAGDVTLSYAQLRDSARKIAGALIRNGIKHGDRIGVLAPNWVEWIEIVIGASGAGATAVPFSTWSTPQELDFLIADSGISILFAAARTSDRDYAGDLAELLPDIVKGQRAQRYPALRSVVLLRPGAKDPFAPFEQFLSGGSDELTLAPGVAAGAGNDGLILYTSGSSAHPKAVRLKHAGIIENGFNIGERQGLKPGDKVMISPPLFWSYGSANALPATLTHGATAVLLERFDPAEALRLIEKHQCTALYTLPGMTSALVRAPSFSPERVRSLRTGLTIGSAQDVREAAVALGISEICNIYGATETYGNCCVTWHHWPLERRMNCQGPPLPGNRLRFVDVETGEPVAAGEPGLVEVSGYVTHGYTGASADQNEIAFSADGYYRTGDVGRLNADGDFEFVGRNTEMIKRAGINVSPVEVENVLLQHPSVEAAGVVGAPDPALGQVIVAFVVAKTGQTASPAELTAHCRSLASKYKVPDIIQVCDKLPTTATGKMQRRDLKQIAADLAQTKGAARG